MSTRYELRKLLEKHGIADSFVPLLPFSGEEEKSTKFHFSQLDLCAQKNDCDKCEDLKKCLKLYDSLC